MTFDPNDHRLTAYVLGELDESERPEIEAMLESSHEARQAVAEIRQTIGWLSDRLREEQAPQLDGAVVESAKPTMAAAAPPRWSRKVVLRLSAVAALLLIGGTVFFVSFSLVPGAAPRPHYASYARPILPSESQVRQAPSRELAAAASPAASSAPAAGTEGMMKLRRSGAVPLSPRGGMGPRLGRVDRFNIDSNSVSPPAPSTNPAATVADGMSRTNVGAQPAEGMMRGMAGMGANGPTMAGRMTNYYKQVPTRQPQGGAQGGRQAGQNQPGQNSAPGQMYAYAVPPNVNGQVPPPPAPAEKPKVALALARRGEAVADRSRKLTERDKDIAPEAELRQQVANVEAAPEPLAAAPQPSGEVFAPIVDNPFIPTTVDAQSTFSIDVDTAGYANVRRYLTQNMLPPRDAVRIEELLNYFPYDDAPPSASAQDPFAVHVEVAACPWNAAHRLARVGIAARPIDQSQRPPSNLVFLLDVSGSMNEELPMIKWGLAQLVEQLGENDRVAIVVYASASGLVLPSTSCLHKAEILEAIERLQSGGSTNGGAGMQLAYQVAAEHFIKDGTNRVLWATDGDFNVGITGQDALVNLVQTKAKSGVFLTVLGCGTGNIKDGPLEQIADKGNGHYAYIDSPKEAYRVLVEQMGSTLVNVAKDVKIQVDFEPASVSAFRLIGYENRVMAHQDFADDTKDAGEIGAGHHVTALYELAPTGEASKGGAKLMTVKLRYKKPDGDTSRLLEFPAKDPGTDFGHASDDLKLAAAVAGFGMLLRDSPYKGTLTYAGDLEIARSILPRDRSGYRKELVELIQKAQTLTPGPSQAR